MSYCYVIIFNNNLYYYIGSTIDIINRVKTHNSNIENIIQNILYSNCNLLKLFSMSILPYFIKSEIIHNYGLCYNILPIYISTNYLKKFNLLYPLYKLSKGEWIILKYVTDLTIKILEQSLIDKFKPKLNTIKSIGIRP